MPFFSAAKLPPQLGACLHLADTNEYFHVSGSVLGRMGGSKRMA